MLHRHLYLFPIEYQGIFDVFGPYHFLNLSNLIQIQLCITIHPQRYVISYNC